MKLKDQKNFETLTNHKRKNGLRVNVRMSKIVRRLIKVGVGTYATCTNCQALQQRLCGGSCTWADDVWFIIRSTVHSALRHVPGCMGCHKAIAVITGRAHWSEDLEGPECSDQMKTLKGQSAHTYIRAVGIVCCSWLPFSINRVLNLTNIVLNHF